MIERAPGPILFFATGVCGLVGGIASANRNVLAALQTLGAETGRSVRTFVLGEGIGGQDYRAFDGDKSRFALKALASLPGADLAVFDHVHLAPPILFLPNGLRPPTVVCAHGSEASRRIRAVSAKVFRRADLVVTNSSFTLRCMRSRVAHFQGAACPLGLPPQFEIFAAPPPLSTEPIVLEAADGQPRALGARVMLLVGRMDAGEREKGHRELMAVMPAVLKQYPDAQLVFAGDGSDLADLRTLAKSSAAAANLFLTGRASNEMLKALYGKAFVFAMPSRQEGFGLVYLEAMNYAKPCLACRDDGGADVVVDGETGVLVSPEVEPEELIEALSFLLADPIRARRYGEAGWRRMTEHFSSTAHQARFIGLVRPLLRNRSPNLSGIAAKAPIVP